MQSFLLVSLCVLSLNSVFSQNQISWTNQDVYYPSYPQGNIVHDQLKVDFPQSMVYVPSNVIEKAPIWARNTNQLPIANDAFFVSPQSNIDHHQYLPFGHGHRVQFVQDNNFMGHGAVFQPGQNSLQHLVKSHPRNQVMDPMLDYAAIQPMYNQVDQHKISNVPTSNIQEGLKVDTNAQNLNSKPKLGSLQVSKPQPSKKETRLNSKPVDANTNYHAISTTNSESNIKKLNTTMKTNDASYKQKLQQEQQLQDLIRQERAKLLKIKLQQTMIKLKQEELLKKQVAGSKKPTGESKYLKQSMKQNLQEPLPSQQNASIKKSMQRKQITNKQFGKSMQQNKQSNKQFGKSQTSFKRLPKQKLNLYQNQRTNQNRQSQQQQNVPIQRQQMMSRTLQQRQSRQQLRIQQRQMRQLKQGTEEMKRQRLLEQQQSINQKREQLQKIKNDRHTWTSGRYAQRGQRIQSINILG